MRKLCFIVSVLLPLIACNRAIEEQPEEGLIGGAAYYNHYIQTYIDVTDIVQVINNNDGIIFSAIGQMYLGSDFCDKFNDVGFNRQMADFTTSCILNHFVKIDLVSNSDFDQTHRAGTSLGDIAYFVGGSAQQFVKCKYADDCRFRWGVDNPESHKKIAGVGLWYHYGYSPLYIKLQDISGECLKLSSDTFGISFASMPTLSQKHTFTLTVTDCNGKEVKVSFDWECVN